MNEMTVPKITLLLDTFAKACGEKSKAKELCREAINFIVKQEREGEVIAVLAEARRIALEQQQQQIERLKCCGNCRRFETVCGEGKCFVDCEPFAGRYDKKSKYAEGSGKCDKWEGLK